MNPPAWLTLEQACDRAQVSPDTIQRWISTSYLVPTIHYGGDGRLRRFDPEMLDAAVRFQTDADGHAQAIAAKRKSLKRR